MGHMNLQASETPSKLARPTAIWYNNRSQDDSENESLVNSSFDFDMAGASTPLRTCGRPAGPGDGDSSMAFMSPMKKLDNLHLESELEGVDEEGAELGNQTLIDGSDSDVEYGGTTTNEPAAPQYINQRKRHLDSPQDVDMVTPRPARHAHGALSKSDMSICVNNSTSNSFKLSFSNSDSTPCPIQPRKKSKLKFKTSPQSTPSQTKLTKAKNLLNLQNSVKTSVSPNPLRNKLSAITHDSEEWDDDDDDGEDDYLPRNSLISSPHQSSTLNTSVSSNQHKNINSTPISQSTPANSRAPTPNQSPPTPPTVEEFGESINGYKFIKPTTKPIHSYYSYHTPDSKVLKSQELKNSYNRSTYETTPNNTVKNGQYEIIGDLPMSSAGIMDEHEDLHVGDKRINDPYLHPRISSTPTSRDLERNDIREGYFKSSKMTDLTQLKLPLLAMFKDDLLDAEEIIRLINDGQSVMNFYKYITLESEDLMDLLKKERLKWHPDKWNSKLLSHQSKENLVINKHIIDNLCQSLNSIIENYT